MTEKGGMVRLVNSENGAVIARRVAVARSLFDRMRGLLGRDSLPPGEGMLIERCSSIHTFFMRFPIDVVFLDRRMAVVKVSRHIAPWRLASAFGAASVLEMAAGALDDQPLPPGTLLAVEEAE